MDVNDQLDRIRYAVARAQQFSDLGQAGANYTWQLERAADAFTLLDDWLSRGGSRPAAWQYVHPLGDAHLPSREQAEQGNGEPVPDFARRLDIARGYYAGIRDATPDDYDFGVCEDCPPGEVPLLADDKCRIHSSVARKHV